MATDYKKPIIVDDDLVYFDPQYLDDCANKIYYYPMETDSTASYVTLVSGKGAVAYGDGACLIVIGTPISDYVLKSCPILSRQIGEEGGKPIMKYSF